MTDIFLAARQPYRKNKQNASQLIRATMPDLIQRPDRPEIVVLHYHRDSLDTHEDVLEVVSEVWRAHRSSFLSKTDDDDGGKQNIVDITLVLHLSMTTAMPEFRVKKIAYRDGYTGPGEGSVYVDEDYFKNLGFPESLTPAFDCDIAVARLKKQFPVRSSTPLLPFFSTHDSMSPSPKKKEKKKGKKKLTFASPPFIFFIFRGFSSALPPIRTRAFAGFGSMRHWWRFW